MESSSGCEVALLLDLYPTHIEVIAEDDSGSIEGVELLESSDSSGTLVIFSFSSMQAVSDSIEIAATVNVNNFILKNQKKRMDTKRKKPAHNRVNGRVAYKVYFKKINPKMPTAQTYQAKCWNLPFWTKFMSHLRAMTPKINATTMPTKSSGVKLPASAHLAAFSGFSKAI